MTTESKSQVSIRGKERDSNLELYRIIAMLAIIAHHYVVNSNLLLENGPIYSDINNWRSLFLLVVGGWGKIGINCFVLITGYFMCKSRITAKKFVRLLTQFYFYKIIIFVFLAIIGFQQLTGKEIIKALLPIKSVSDGFISCFFIFYLLIPFLNKLVNHLTEKEHVILLAILITVYVGIGTLPLKVTFNYVTWFSVLYLTSSYVALYPKRIFNNQILWGGGRQL